MREKLEERRQEILRARAAEGKIFAVGGTRLRQVMPGSLPKNRKTSSTTTNRPRVLFVCHRKRAEMRVWNFGVLRHFKDASNRYRRGELTAEFPSGTHRPYVGPEVSSTMMH